MNKIEFPFKEGEDYWTIEDGKIIQSCWDDVSEEIYLEKIKDKNFVVKEYYFNSFSEAKIYLLDKKLKKSLYFIIPSDFISWSETHFEIVSAIVAENNSDNPCEKILNIAENQGIKGLYELANDLTFKFENQYKGVKWGEEIEYFETIEEFINKEIYGR